MPSLRDVGLGGSALYGPWRPSSYGAAQSQQCLPPAHARQLHALPLWGLRLATSAWGFSLQLALIKRVQMADAGWPASAAPVASPLLIHSPLTPSCKRCALVD